MESLSCIHKFTRGENRGLCNKPVSILCKKRYHKGDDETNRKRQKLKETPAVPAYCAIHRPGYMKKMERAALKATSDGPVLLISSAISHGEETLEIANRETLPELSAPSHSVPPSSDTAGSWNSILEPVQPGKSPFVRQLIGGLNSTSPLVKMHLKAAIDETVHDGTVNTKILDLGLDFFKVMVERIGFKPDTLYSVFNENPELFKKINDEGGRKWASNVHDLRTEVTTSTGTYLSLDAEKLRQLDFNMMKFAQECMVADGCDVNVAQVKANVKIAGKRNIEKGKVVAHGPVYHLGLIRAAPRSEVPTKAQKVPQSIHGDEMFCCSYRRWKLTKLESYAVIINLSDKIRRFRIYDECTKEVVDIPISPWGGLVFSHTVLHCGLPNMEKEALYAGFFHVDLTSDLRGPVVESFADDVVPIRVGKIQSFCKGDKAPRKSRNDTRTAKELFECLKKGEHPGEHLKCSSEHPQFSLGFKMI